MHRYKLIIAYDGSAYSGWQVQNDVPSIQKELSQVIQKCLHQEVVKVVASGRTDAGVHAVGQVVHFDSIRAMEAKRLRHALNANLPATIRVYEAEEVGQDFHARYNTTGKEYHYYIHLDPIMNPFKRFYCWHVMKPVDLDLLKQAASLFIGTHDFTSFTNEAHEGTASICPIRTLYRLDICATDGGIRLEFEGDGFLYKMVRNIVGTLISVACLKRKIEEIDDIFLAKDRRKASHAAPARGLFLVKVHYKNDKIKASLLPAI